MLFDFKPYQTRVLKHLGDFLEQSRIVGPENAFTQCLVAQESTYADIPYRHMKGLDSAPYVCLRLPTGGGKTFLAAHSIGVAAKNYLEKDYPVVLWLVPTNAIRTQTRDVLNRDDHPCREAINKVFGERVAIFDIEDIENIRPQDLTEKLCVIIGTLATLRVASTEGRQVYAHKECFEPHFAGINPNTEGFERIEEGPDAGKIKFSFANLMHFHKPLIIMDEAHNARTRLTFEVLSRISPACIIEFTATPDSSRESGSNILCSVSATEVKAEEMIKLPIILTEHITWQEALHDTVLTRIKLETQTAGEADYVRPIALIQAESKDRDITVEVVKNCLIENEKIASERIAIATGSQRELDGINLLDPSCRIEYIITIEALKEGWDCPFAYVFCSVATVHSGRDVEQILGRVLRMPYAKRRKSVDLNRAYAHVSALSFAEAAKSLHDRLVDMGFEEPEIDAYVENGQQPLLPEDTMSLFSYRQPEPLVMMVGLEPAFINFTAEEQANVQVEKKASGEYSITVQGPINDELGKRLVEAMPATQRKHIRGVINEHRRMQEKILTPSQRGEKFLMPNLCVYVQGEITLADKESLLGAKGWNLLDYSQKLTEIEFSISETVHSFEIDINGNKVTYGLIDEKKQLGLLDVKTTWSMDDLVIWLDKQVRRSDVRQEIMLEYVRRAVSHLVEDRKIGLSTLIRFNYPLAKFLFEKIRKNREEAAKAGYQELLFGPSAAVETSFEFPTWFTPDNYAPSQIYCGYPYRFKKHFYPVIGFLENLGEEFDCAVAIDTLPQVKYWVRNVPKTEYSFKIQTSTDMFYPDFVAELTDGRLLIVEYKGKPYVTNDDSKEKKLMGRMWEEGLKNKNGLFIMVEKKDADGRDVRTQLLDKISGK